MKKIAATALAITMLLGMTACGNDSSSSGTSDSSSAESSESTKNSGETAELEGYSVFVPEGWVSVPSSDKKQVKLYKTDNADNIFGVPEIDITYKATGDYELMTGMFESFEAVSPLTIGSRTWEGVKGAYDSSKELISLHAVEGSGYIAADIWTKVNDVTISADDSDVKAILEGITVKN